MGKEVGGPGFLGNYSYNASDGIRKETDPPDKTYSFVELLYPQYFRPKGLAEYQFLIGKAR